MNDSSALSIALGLLKYAVLIAPALGEIIRSAVAAFEPTTSDQQALADQVKAILPVDGESDKALADLAAAGAPVGS